MIAAILSGGENRRMPLIKGFLDVGGMTIIERSLAVLKEVFGKVVINTNCPELYFRFGVPLIGDIRKERGPMTGILSVLYAAGEESVFVVACDMPFLQKDLITFMGGLFRERQEGEAESGKIDAMVPYHGGLPEPLFGIYTKNCIGRIEEMMAEGKRSLNELLSTVRVLAVDEGIVRSIDPSGRSFVNVNTMEDYEKIGGVRCLV